MSISSVILDSQPDYLMSVSGEHSLAMLPYGHSTLAGEVSGVLFELTGRPTTIIRPFTASQQYDRILKSAGPIAGPSVTTDEFCHGLRTLEPSDWILLIDPRAYPSAGYSNRAPLEELLTDLSDAPRIARHLVALDATEAGTNERVELDGEGRVHRIQRYYDAVTWTVTAGVCCSVVPASSMRRTPAEALHSLTELRRYLAAHQQASRDVPLRSPVFDLTTERGALRYSQFALERQTSAKGNDFGTAPTASVSVHPSARLLGVVAIHAGVTVAEDVTIVGPAVVGPGARIEAGAVIAQSVVLSGVRIRRGSIVRHQVIADGDLGTRPDPQDDVRETGDAAGFKLVDELRRPRVYPIFKRLLDGLVAAGLLVILSPLLLLIGLLIRLDSRGPILYGDLREAKDGRPFRCFKFRTMVVGANVAQRDLMAANQVDGPQFKMVHDPRVTRLGRFLRAISLDELPQLLNVLLGQMSLVGPRPSPFRENQTCVPWRDARLSVRPGITGLWQVCRHDRASGDFHQWIYYDMQYVRNMSLLADLKIIGATVVTLGGKSSVPIHWILPQERE